MTKASDGDATLSPEARAPRLERFCVRVLQGAIGYFLIAMVMLPEAGSPWIGPAATPVPVLALVQIPKMAAVEPIRRKLAMHYAKSDVSRSYSPHYRRARVTSLVIGYAMVVGVLSLLCLAGTRFSKRAAVLVVLLIGIATLDGYVTLKLGSPGRPGALSIY